MGLRDDLVRSAQVKELYEQRLYKKAYGVLVDMNPRMIRSVADMKMCAEIYSKNEDYEKAKELYSKLYDKELTRAYLQQLIYVCLKMEQFDEASEYYVKFVKTSKSQRDNLILHYRIEKAKGADYDVLISILEELKEQEHLEEWEYELAKLYQLAGREEDCRKECESIKTWFGHGEIVERAQLLLAYLDAGGNFSAFNDKDYTIKEEAPNPMDTATIPPLDPSVLKRQRLAEREKKRRAKEDKEAFLIADAEEGYLYDEILDEQAKEYAERMAKMGDAAPATPANSNVQAPAGMQELSGQPVQSYAASGSKTESYVVGGAETEEYTVSGVSSSGGSDVAGIGTPSNVGEANNEERSSFIVETNEVIEPEEDDTYSWEEINAIGHTGEIPKAGENWQAYDDYDKQEEEEFYTENTPQANQQVYEGAIQGGAYPSEGMAGISEVNGYPGSVNQAGVESPGFDTEEIPTYTIEQQEKFIRDSQSGTGITKDLSKEINAILDMEKNQEIGSEEAQNTLDTLEKLKLGGDQLMEKEVQDFNEPLPTDAVDDITTFIKTPEVASAVDTAVGTPTQATVGAAEPVVAEVPAPAPVVETPVVAPVAETPVPTPSPVVETPAPTPAPVVETPAPVVAAPEISTESAKDAVNNLKIADNTMELAGNVQEVLKDAGIKAGVLEETKEPVELEADDSAEIEAKASGTPVGMSEINLEDDKKDDVLSRDTKDISNVIVKDKPLSPAEKKEEERLSQIMPEPDMPEVRQVLPQKKVAEPVQRFKTPITTNARMGETQHIMGEGTNATLPETELPTTKALHKGMQDILTLISGEPELTHYVLIGHGNERILGVTKKIVRIMNNKGFLSSTNIAQIDSKQLNKLDINAFKDQLKGSCLLVTNASGLLFTTIGVLFELMDEYSDDFVVILSDEGDTMDKLFKITPVLARRFQYIIDVSKYTEEDYL